ncbi:hypothetical protein AB0D30_06415 [Streptomyces sp. NPDC048409]|uniref:hypothetical protein n=1 Tax=Streptomyces sp. NPDC048409 TaxID=3154723 RepID=UPI00343CCF98
MGRRGGTLPGGAAALALGLALLTGCATTGTSTRPPTHPAALPASPSATSDAKLCAAIVAHWSREVLDSGAYGDYQSMGLSNGQYEILRDVVDAARAVRHRQGAAAAGRLIDRRARAACTERYRGGAPTGGPWQ